MTIVKLVLGLPLVKALKDKNPRVRATAAETLGIIGDKRALTYLEKVLNDKDKDVRFKASKAINKIEGIKKKVNVPEWNDYFPNLEAANEEQKTFYKKWIKELNNNNFLDIDGNLSYVYVFLYTLIENFIENRDINYFLENLDKIDKGYGNYDKIKEYLIIWKSDAYRFIGKYNKALEVMKGKGLLSFEATKFAEIISKEKSNFIEGHDLIYMVGTDKLTNFGKKHEKEIADIGTLFLNDFYIENGLNIVQFFLQSFNLKNLSENDFNRLKKFFPKKEQFSKLKTEYITHEKKITDDEIYKQYNHGLFRGAPINIDPTNIDKKYSFVPSIIMEAMKNEVKRIIRECENTVREEMDLPKVGEGWISETELYYKIKEEFPQEIVLHHGRPSWLGKQHLDIYFPKKNIAIEYQGEQHQNSNEYFGGEKAFKHRKKLDKQKMRKCEDNRCKLIYVYPDYNFEQVRAEIIKYLSIHSIPRTNKIEDY